MTPTDIEGRTRLLGAPADWDESQGPCEALPILDHGGWMISAWQPDEVELERLAAGEPIYLFVRGDTHPAVGLGVWLKP